MARVAVIGGGLAGMAASLRLLERGFSVRLFEAGPRLGGKAGADRGPNGFDEHGYHLFPAWYVNTRALLAELGLTHALVDLDAAFWLRPGCFPDFRSLRSPASPRSFIRNLFSGVMAPEELLLFYIACLDLAAQPERRANTLDQQSLTGFLRSRPYATDGLADHFHDAVLKSVSAPGFQVSAMTLKRVVSFWLKYPSPLSSVLRGDLQTCFIEPFASKLRAAGCSVALHSKVRGLKIEGRRVSALEIHGPTGPREFSDFDYCVVAVPAEQLAALASDAVHRAAPELSGVKYVRTVPMSALNVYMPAKIAGMPTGHVSLAGSHFGLSFIDVSGIWPGYTSTTINAIASDTVAISHLSHGHQERLLMADLKRFLPWVDQATSVVFKPNTEAPLFMSSVGVWPRRPTASTQLSNTAIAGDFVQTSVDLASMEGAIAAGYAAANVIAEEARLQVPGWQIPAPSTVPAWLLRPVALGLIPAAVLCKYIGRLRTPAEERG